MALKLTRYKSPLHGSQEVIMWTYNNFTLKTQLVLSVCDPLSLYCTDNGVLSMQN